MDFSNREWPLLDGGYYRFCQIQCEKYGDEVDTKYVNALNFMDAAKKAAPEPGAIRLTQENGTKRVFKVLEKPSDLERLWDMDMINADGREYTLKVIASMIYQIKQRVMGPAFFSEDEAADGLNHDADFDLREIKERYGDLNVIWPVWRDVTADEFEAARLLSHYSCSDYIDSVNQDGKYSDSYDEFAEPEPGKLRPFNLEE